MYNYYKMQLLDREALEFLNKYLNCPSIARLRNIGYFCGMDYASKSIYDFKTYISRYDHSLDVALITWKYTHDKSSTLAGLFHDVATPCFAHVIDYMNKDYMTQESTEEYTEYIIKSDRELLECLKEDNICIDDVINFKKYSIVDIDRPKLCADRLDGLILTGMFWTKDVSLNDIDNILNNLTIYDNEDNVLELGFTSIDVLNRVNEISESIDIACHSYEDNYMMELLANLTKYIIDNKYIEYEELYRLKEDNIHNIFSNISDLEFRWKYLLFKTISKNEVPKIEMPPIKKRELKPLVNGIRL